MCKTISRTMFKNITTTLLVFSSFQIAFGQDALKVFLNSEKSFEANNGETTAAHADINTNFLLNQSFIIPNLNVFADLSFNRKGDIVTVPSGNGPMCLHASDANGGAQEKVETDYYAFLRLHGLQEAQTGNKKDQAIGLLFKELAFGGVNFAFGNRFINDKEKGLAIGFRLEADYSTRKLSQTLSDSTTIDVKPATFNMQFGLDMIFAKRAILYANYNYFEVTNGISATKEYLGTQAIVQRYWSFGLQGMFGFQRGQLKGSQVALDLGFIYVNDELSRMFGDTNDKVIFTVKAGINIPIL